jgi:hypothetical protein
MGMKGGARKGPKRWLKSPGERLPAGFSVDRVTDQGRSGVLGVNPYLMGPPSFDPHSRPKQASALFFHPEVTRCGTPIGPYRHAKTVTWMATDRF